MKTSFFKKGILAMGIACCMQLSAVENPVDYVNTLVGTQSKYELSTGNTYPATAMPWGMNFWTPQTGEMGNGWTYRYDADKIRGIQANPSTEPVDERLRAVLHYAYYRRLSFRRGETG